MSDSSAEESSRESSETEENKTSLGPQLIVEQFCEAWNRGARPEISTFLPRASSEYPIDVLTALIQADMRQRSNADENIRLERYLEEFSVLSNHREQLIALIIDEYTIRRGIGDEVARSELEQRFPKVFAELQQRLGLDVQLGDASDVTAPIQSLDHELATGTVVEEFEVLRLLGTGGAGRVYLAKQLPLDRLVALKISAGHTEEGAKQAAIEHENIIAVYSEKIIGRHRLLAMQFVPGLTLAGLLLELNDRQRSRIRWSDLRMIIENCGATETSSRAGQSRFANNLTFAEVACRWVLGLAQALEFAHQSGILHRDIKPENILVTPDGRAMLADFNVAVRAANLGHNDVENLGGTLEYMSPEHLSLLIGTDSDTGTSFNANATSVDAQSDVYSLGIVFIELLTGVRPFPIGESDGSLISTARTVLAQRLQSTPMWDVASLPIPSSLIAIIDKCLIPDRGGPPGVPARYESARQLAEDLQCFLNRRPLRHAVIKDWFERIKNWCRLHRRFTLFLAQLVIVVIAIFGWDYWSAGRQLSRAEQLVAQASDLGAEPDTQQSGRLVAKAEQIVLDQNSFLEYAGLRKRRARLYHDFGLVLAKQKNYEAAIPYFEKSIQHDQQLGEAHNSLGFVYFHLQKFHDAVKCFDHAIQLGCQEVDVLPNRGAAKAAMGDVNGARSDFERTLKLKPDSAAAKSNLKLLEEAVRVQLELESD